MMEILTCCWNEIDFVVSQANIFMYDLKNLKIRKLFFKNNNNTHFHFWFCLQEWVELFIAMNFAPVVMLSNIGSAYKNDLAFSLPTISNFTCFFSQHLHWSICIF